MNPPIRLAIVDDEALIRKGLSLLIEDFADVEVVIEVGNGQELLDQLATLDSLPQVVLLDLNMPIMDGVATTRQLTKEFPDVRVVILSTHFSKAFILNMLDIGAASYLPKNTEPEEVELTIRQVVEKGFYYNEEVLKIVQENFGQRSRKLRSGFPDEITEREREILQLICEQLTTAEIAARLYISPRTVDGHRNNLMAKLNCRNTAGLVAVALQRSLVKLDPLF